MLKSQQRVGTVSRATGNHPWLPPKICLLTAFSALQSMTSRLPKRRTARPSSPQTSCGPRRPTVTATLDSLRKCAGTSGVPRPIRADHCDPSPTSPFPKRLTYLQGPHARPENGICKLCSGIQVSPKKVNFSLFNTSIIDFVPSAGFRDALT